MSLLVPPAAGMQDFSTSSVTIRCFAVANREAVEAYLPGIGWVRFDPTNDVIAQERHVRVAIGRDDGDVPPTSGVFREEAGSELGVLVTVSLADAPVKREKVMPMTTWVTPETGEPVESFDRAQ